MYQNPVQSPAINPVPEPDLSATVDRLFKDASSKRNSSACIIERAAQDGVDIISVRNIERQTLLHKAAGYGRNSLLTYLIERGADVNVQDREGQAPLHYASNHAHRTIAKKLVETGANVNLLDYKGWSPLRFALARKENAERITPLYWDIVTLLLDFGADPYIKSDSGRSCLDRIRDDEQRRMVRLLHLTKKLKDCDDSDRPSREKIVDKYLRPQDFFDLVKTGDDNVEILQVLLTQRLLKSRLSTCDNITPLHRAAGHNHLEVAKLFIESGANVNATDDHGRIPLHNAAQYGHIEMIELLINKRSDINKQDNEGFSPLHVAASNKTFTACLKLIELGANVNLKSNAGELSYDLAESDDVREVLRPESLRNIVEMIPSTSDQAIYIGIQEDTTDTLTRRHQISLPDELMLDSTSDERLFSNINYKIKKITLNEHDWRYHLVKSRLLDTIVTHTGDTGGRFSSYEIISIERILHEKVWHKYRLGCQRLEIDHGVGSRNEKLLFHGSNFIDKIQSQGFDERYAQRDGMFGAGIYFASHSSKSNQYTFGWGQGCQEHMDKSCYRCERKMIYAQVALGRSLISKEAIPNCAHAPPGYSSVTGLPEATDNLIYPEYVIYSGDQAYPLYVIKYRIVP